MIKYVHRYDVVQIDFGNIEKISCYRLSYNAKPRNLTNLRFNNNINRKCVLLILYKAEFKNTLMN